MSRTRLSRLHEAVWWGWSTASNDAGKPVRKHSEGHTYNVAGWGSCSVMLAACSNARERLTVNDGVPSHGISIQRRFNFSEAVGCGFAHAGSLMSEIADVHTANGFCKPLL
jgi:hypothetical protein